MSEIELGYTKNISGADFDQVRQRTVDALAAEGFGVLTEIDVKATMRKKLDVDFRRYQILGACNPGFAHRALSAEPTVGLMMPCNVLVYEEDDGSTTVSFARPEEMFKLVNLPLLEPLMEEVSAAIWRAFDSV